MTSSRDTARWAPPVLDSGAAGDETSAPTRDWALADLEHLPDPRAADPANEIDPVWSDGYAAGLAEGTRELTERFSPIEAMLTPLIQRLREAELLASAEREADVVALALAVARHLVQRELTADPTLVRELARRALALMPADAPVRVRVHPDDLALLELGVSELAGGGASPALHWEADDTLDRGDFVLDSPNRIVDGRTDVALRNLYDRLTLY